LLISEEVRERILRCPDVDVLERWSARSVTVTSVEELFAE
jgi:hypothetical protein